MQYVCRFAKPGKFDVGYTAHPSFVTEEELGGITTPLSIAAAGKFGYVAESLLFFSAS